MFIKISDQGMNSKYLWIWYLILSVYVLNHFLQILKIQFEWTVCAIKKHYFALKVSYESLKSGVHKKKKKQFLNLIIRRDWKL